DAPRRCRSGAPRCDGMAVPIVALRVAAATRRLRPPAPHPARPEVVMKPALFLLSLALAGLPAAARSATIEPRLVPFVPTSALVAANPRRSYPPSCLSVPLP